MTNPFKVGDRVRRKAQYVVKHNHHPSYRGEPFVVKAIRSGYVVADDGAELAAEYLEYALGDDIRWFVYVYDRLDPSQCIVLRTGALTRKFNALLDTLLPQVDRIEAIKGDTRLVYLGTAASEHGAWEPKT